MSAVASTVSAQFDSVINVPPSAAPVPPLPSSTQLNIFESGALGDWFYAWDGGSPSPANIEINLVGGTIGDNLILGDGVTLNIFDGVVGNWLDASQGSVVNIYGGVVGDSFDVFRGSVVNIRGGAIGVDFDVVSGCINFCSGVPAPEVHIFGQDYLINGAPLGGLTPGEPFLIEERDVTLSGSLVDGSDFSFDLISTTNTFPDDFFPPADKMKLTVTVATDPLLGDYNIDGTVDAADYNAFRDALGSTSALAADGNKNGIVDPVDYHVWSHHFGASQESPATVPEPSSCVAICLATPLLHWRW